MWGKRLVENVIWGEGLELQNTMYGGEAGRGLKLLKKPLCDI